MKEQKARTGYRLNYSSIEDPAKVTRRSEILDKKNKNPFDKKGRKVEQKLKKRISKSIKSNNNHTGKEEKGFKSIIKKLEDYDVPDKGSAEKKSKFASLCALIALLMSISPILGKVKKAFDENGLPAVSIESVGDFINRAFEYDTEVLEDTDGSLKIKINDTSGAMEIRSDEHEFFKVENHLRDGKLAINMDRVKGNIVLVTIGLDKGERHEHPLKNGHNEVDFSGDEKDNFYLEYEDFDGDLELEQ